MTGENAHPIHEELPSRRISSWVANLPVDRTREVERFAVEGVRDLVGCMIGGCIEPTAIKAAKVAGIAGGGVTSIVGQSNTVPAPWAAFANGTASHVLDFDDSFEPLTGHPSAPLVPALLALAEEQGSSGSAVLDAYVVGLEVIASIGRALNPSHYTKGWHSTATIGVIGAATACARLMKLDAEEVNAAISIAVSRSSGSRLQLGFPMKSVHAGFAAHDAVVASFLAANGILGNEESLVGTRSFSDLYSDARVDSDAFTMPSVDQPLAIEKPGITFKPYPTCGSTHRSLDALLHLRDRHGFSPDDVEVVDITIPALNVNNLIYDDPKTGMEARFSMQYCAALALWRGSLRLADFEDNAISNPSVRRLMPLVQMHTLPGSETTDRDYLELPAHTVIRLKSGNVLEDTRYRRQGSVEMSMSENSHKAKFIDCARHLFNPSQCDHVLELLATLPKSTTINPLMSLLRLETQ